MQPQFGFRSERSGLHVQCVAYRLDVTICLVSSWPCTASLSTGYTQVKQGFTCKLAHLGWRFSRSWRRCRLLGLRRWGCCSQQHTECKSAFTLQSAEA